MRIRRTALVTYKYTLFCNFVNSCPQPSIGRRLCTKRKRVTLANTYMLKKLRIKINKKYRPHVVGLGLVAFSAFIVLSPWAHQGFGNLFFGKVPALYNVTLARFFFERSAYPFFGDPAPYAHYQLSRTYFIQGSLGSAVEEAEKELEAYPDNKRAYYILGLTYGYLNQEKKAIEAFGKFIEWQPDSWAARNDKAWLEFRIGDIDAALATIEPVSDKKYNPWVQNTYGTVLLNKKRYKEAKEAFLNAKKSTDTMTAEAWGGAYPGNDPRIYGTGLNAMKKSIEGNFKLAEEKMKG